MIKMKYLHPEISHEKIDAQSHYFRIHRKDIAYLKFIIESYEGMAVVRTKDPKEAIVELIVAPGWEKDLNEVIESLGKEMKIERLPSYRNKPQSEE